MTHRPLISVIIPCYNYARYVGSAIESAITQDYEHKEVIVVNDGSTDESRSVISSYQPQVRALEQPNRGSIAAYNHGFSVCRGDLVMFLDADDLLEAGALSKVQQAWYPGCAKVQFDLRIIDAASNDLGRRFCNFRAGYDSERVRRAFRETGTYRWPVTAGNAYARFFAEPLFPLAIDHGPDGYLNTVAPVYGDVVTIPEVLGSYRLHGTNQWSSGGQARLPVRIRDRYREVQFMKEHAERRGVEVPSSNVLDHELAFINYRMMALRLGLDYVGRDADRASKLLLAAYRLLGREHLPAKLKFAHLAWFTAVALSPAPLAKSLVGLRCPDSELRTRLQDLRRALAL